MARRGPSNGSTADRLSPGSTTRDAVVSRGILMQDPVPADPRKRNHRLKQEELRGLIKREQEWLEREMGEDVDPRIRKRVKNFWKELGRLAEGIQSDEPLRSEAGLKELIERIRNLCVQTGRGLNDAPHVKNAVNDLREDLIDYLQAHYALRARAVLAGTDQDPDDTDDDMVDDMGDDALDGIAGEPIDTKKMVAHLRGLVFGRLDDFVRKLYAEPQWNVAEAITLNEVAAICRSFNALADALESAVTSVVHEGEREVPLNVVQKAGVKAFRAFEIDKTGLPAPARPHFKALVCLESAESLELVAKSADLADPMFAFPVRKRLELSDVQALFRPGPRLDAKEELTNTPWSQAESDFVAQESGEGKENSGALATHLNEHFHGGVEVRTATSVKERIREIKLETETMDREEVYMRFRGAMISRLPSYVASLQADPGMRASLLPLKKETVQALYRFWNTILTWLDEQLQGWAEERQGYRFAMVKEGMLQWLSLKDELDEESVEMMEGETLSREVQRFKECVWDWLRKQVEAAQTLEDFRNPPFVLYATEFSEDTVRQIFRPDAYGDSTQAMRVVPTDDDQEQMIEQWDGTDPQAMVDRLNNDFHGGASMWSIDMLQSYRAELDEKKKGPHDPEVEEREPIPWKARYSGMLVRQLPEFVRALFGDSDLEFNQRISEGELYALLRVCRKNMLRGKRQVVIKWPGPVSSDSIMADRRLEKKISEYLRKRLLNPVIDKVQRVLETRSWGGDPSDYAPLEGNREINVGDFQDAFRPIELRATWPWSDKERKRCRVDLSKGLDKFKKMGEVERKRGNDFNGYAVIYTEIGKVAEGINRDFHGGASVRKFHDFLFIFSEIFSESLRVKESEASLGDTQLETLKRVFKRWIKSEGITDMHSALSKTEKLNGVMEEIGSRNESDALTALKVMQMLAVLEQLFEEIEAEQASGMRESTARIEAGDAPASDVAGAEAEFEPAAEPEPAEEPELMPREHEMLVTVVGAQIERFEWADAAACTAVMLSDAMAPVLDRWAVTLTHAFHGGTTAKRTPALLRQVLPLLIGEIYARRAGDGADGSADVSDDNRAAGDESGSRHPSGGSLKPRMTELPPVAPVGEGAVEQVDPVLVEEVRGLAERVDEELRAVEAAGWKRISIPHKILAVMARRILRGDLPHTTAQLVLYREFLHGFRALFEINDPQGRPSLREVARGDFEEGFLNVMIRLGQCLHLNDFETEPAWAALVNLMQSRQRQREAIRQAIAGLRAEVAHRPEAVERELRAIRYVLGNASGNVRHGLQENLDQLTREHDALQAKQQALTDLEAQEEKLRDRHAAFLEKLEALIAETLTESD